MVTRIPPDAFEFYYSLGPSRSYQAVAKHYGVSKKAVTNLAVKEDWRSRVVERDRKLRTSLEEKALESLEDMNVRHLKSLKVIQGKALEAMKSMPLDSAMNAVRALDLAIRQERVIRGEPGDRSAVDIENVIRKEYDRWMEDHDDDGQDAQAEQGDAIR